MNVPNQMTIGRLFLAVVFCVLLAQYHARDHAARAWMLEVCVWIFLVAAISDIIASASGAAHLTRGMDC